jgi:hypothetical protein
MHRSICFAVAVLAAACSTAQSAPPSSPRASQPESEDAVAAVRPAAVEPEEVVLEDDTETEAPGPRPSAQPGQLFVQRFSGTFHKSPLMLEEKVVAWEDDVLVTDWTLDDGGRKAALRVRTRPSEAGAVVSVTRLAGEEERAASIADFEQMLERTAFAADTNEGLIDATEATCLVGGRERTCKKATYKVTIGDAEATLSVLSSDDLPGRDVAGEIVGSDGQVLYRAEIVEATTSAATTATASAD